MSAALSANDGVTFPVSPNRRSQTVAEVRLVPRSKGLPGAAEAPDVMVHGKLPIRSAGLGPRSDPALDIRNPNPRKVRTGIVWPHLGQARLDLKS